MLVVESRGLAKAYGRFHAIKDLSFTIEKNKITGLIGRNGAGKTTLLKVMAGFFQSTAGEIKVFSENPFNSLKVSSNTILVDDQMNMPQTLSLMEVLESAQNFYENWNMKIARGLLEYFSLHPGQFHSRLSKGMKSTFNVILGIAARCPLTIFDEPTAGMDAAVRKDFYRALLKDYLLHPRTMIISSHLLHEIQDLLEDILLIEKGVKLLHMPVSELKEYALVLRGRNETLMQLTENEELLHREAMGENHSYIVVRNQLSEAKIQKAKTEGIEIGPAAAEDVCIYLTARSKGGVDSVFNRS